MKLALKNIIVNLSQSLSSHCFTATLWVDNKPCFDVKDEGFGEPMQYQSLKNVETKLGEVLESIHQSSPSQTISNNNYKYLDQTIKALVDEHLAAQKTKYQLSHNEIQIVIKERIEMSISEQLKEKNSVSEVGEKRLLATLETVD